MASGKRRATIPGVLLAALAAIAVVLPGALVIGARPSIAVARQSELPRLPAVSGAVRSLADDLDELPIVSSGMAAELMRATILEPELAARAFDAAWARLTLPPIARPALDRFRAGIALVGNTTHAPDHDDPGWDEQVAAALGPLTADPANVTRLNDAAVALFLLGATGDQLVGPPPLDGLPPQFQEGWAPQLAMVGGIRLLQAIESVFPPDRAVRLNLAFLRSITPDLNVSWEVAMEPVQAAVADDPGDVTARVLLASLESRAANAVRGGAARAEATLSVLLAAPATAAIGHAATGDAHLAEGAIRAAEAPYAARAAARRALDAYDAALGLVADPGVYAGRATALVALDAFDEAAVAQQQAVDLAPTAIDLWTGLAEIHEARGDVEGMRAAADRAVDLVLDGTWPPPMRRLRFVTGPGGFTVTGDRGYLGWSLGRERDHQPVEIGSEGVGVVVLDLVPPRISPEESDVRHGALAPQVAFQDAMTARIAAGDVDGAHSLASAWDRSVALSGDWSSAARAAEIVRTGGIQSSYADEVDAASALWAAAASLRVVGRADDASELCAAVAGGPVHPHVPVADAWTCAGVQALRARLPAEAATYLAQAAALEPDANGRDPLIRLMTASAEEDSGDVSAATRLFRLEATEPSDRDDGVALRSRLLALASLGDLALTSGNPLAALEDYDLAAATLERSPPTISSRWEDASAVMAIRAIEQVLGNNRAVARLQSLQPSPGEPPSCAGADRVICEDAGHAFAAAIASDPGRGVYHLNAGWVARLLGEATAARAALATAIELDPTLFPASNDLGVLLAKAGDDEGARQAFLDALAAQPDYALARWNLGILESRAGGAGIVNGQASLARAVVLEPTLRDAPLAFRHDEHTYEFTFDPGAPPQAGAPIGRSYSIAAVVLGAAATAAAIVQLQSTMTGKLVKGVGDAGQRRVERLERHLRPRLAARRRRWRRRLGLAGAALPWLLTAPVLIGLTLWQAARSSPEMAGAAFVIGLTAIVSAIVVHALGHLVAARVLGGRILPAQWLPGVAMAVLLAPIQVATGPFLAERTRIASQAHGAAWWIHAAGPLANAAYAVALYGAYLVTPMPALRLICLMQLAAISYALLPIRPLDGEVIARERPWVLVVAGFVMTAVSAAFALGLL